uniref:DNA topoisomerase n=1 Tax=Ditylenchus dipsaci TaxID=166011 RepID=A0A915EVU6_9BILA
MFLGYSLFLFTINLLGENIGAEIVSVCRQANPRIDVYRAKFSEITPRSVNNAMQNLVRMDDRIVNAVDCRTELDLRIGQHSLVFNPAPPKHFANILDGVLAMEVQNLVKREPPGLKNICLSKADGIWSDCVSLNGGQFPTLGFVVERYKFWKLVGKDLNNKFDFSWERVRLFDMDATRAIHELCKEAKQPRSYS